LKDIEELETITKFENIRNVLLALSGSDEEMINCISENLINKDKNKRIIFEVCGLKSKDKKNKERENILIEQIKEINEKIEYNLYKSCEIGRIHWNKQYLELKNLLERNNGKYPNQNIKGENKLFLWVHRQRCNYRKNKLLSKEYNLLSCLPNFEWEFDKEEKWVENFNLVKEWYEKNNKYPNNHSKIQEEKRLGIWVEVQRGSNRGKKTRGVMTPKRYELLSSLPNFKWNTNKEEEWIDKFNLVKKWCDKNQKLPSSKSKEKEEKIYGSWLIRQRGIQRGVLKTGKITREKKKLLESLKGFKWENDVWLEHYKELFLFYQTKLKYPSYGSKNNDEKKLGSWLSKQRIKYNKPTKNTGNLSDKQIKLLENIPYFTWK
jgi:hypothetical protein